ncbi:MAG: hypothetical protein ACYDHZ_10060 [Dehalococcoidia bacterium]|jgi:hypothetical protein
MAKRKYPSELSTRHVRVNVGDYFLLTELSNKLGITMGEALHLAITAQSRRETKVSPAQIAMPVFTVLPQPPVVVDGSEQAAISIKPKGGVLDE